MKMFFTGTLFCITLCHASDQPRRRLSDFQYQPPSSRTLPKQTQQESNGVICTLAQGNNVIMLTFVKDDATPIKIHAEAGKHITIHHGFIKIAINKSGLARLLDPDRSTEQVIKKMISQVTHNRDALSTTFQLIAQYSKYFLENTEPLTAKFLNKITVKSPMKRSALTYSSKQEDNGIISFSSGVAYAVSEDGKSIEI